MALFPGSPVPSHVSAPEILDPMLKFETDYGYSVRRPRTSRPRRRWTLDYLGQSTATMRTIRRFLIFTRNGVTEFSWFHPTAIEVAQFSPTTPVSVSWSHGLATGMWVGVSNTPNPGINGGVFPITVTSDSSLTLDGSTAAGITGVGNIIIYVPRAIAIMPDNTFPSPTTIIGPERIPIAPEISRGFYSFSVTIEEQF
jgi:hypothetical protein